jgi:hypothetical protein
MSMGDEGDAKEVHIYASSSIYSLITIMVLTLHCRDAVASVDVHGVKASPQCAAVELRAEDAVEDNGFVIFTLPWNFSPRCASRFSLQYNGVAVAWFAFRRGTRQYSLRGPMEPIMVAFDWDDNNVRVAIPECFLEELAPFFLLAPRFVDHRVRHVALFV